MTWKHYSASFKIRYLCLLQIILADKENPQRIQHFIQEKKKKLCFSSHTIYSTFTFQRPSNGNNNESKYILLLESRMQGDFLFTQLSQITSRFVVTCLSPINPVKSLLIVNFQSCVGHDILWLRGRCLVIKIRTYLCRKT